MGWGWDESQDAHRQMYGGYDQPPQHEAKFSHELIAGAASFEAFKLFEDHQRAEGKPVDHAFAKELLAGFAGAEVDKLAETKGMDEYDRIRAREHARKQAEQMYDDHYVSGHGADCYDPNRYGPPDRFADQGYERHEHHHHHERERERERREERREERWEERREGGW